MSPVSFEGLLFLLLLLVASVVVAMPPRNQLAGQTDEDDDDGGDGDGDGDDDSTVGVGVGVGAGRRCEVVDLSPGDPLDFRELPEAADGRVPIPFSLAPRLPWSRRHPAGSDPGRTALRIYVGTGDYFAAERYYVLTLSRSSVTVEKLSGSSGKSKLLETVAGGHRLLRPPQGRGARGLYFRVKTRQDYITVGLYEAGDDAASEPIINYKDTEPLPGPLTHYAFSVRSSPHSPRSVVVGAGFRVLLGCHSRLDVECVHSVECVDHGTSCQASGDDDGGARCDCDENHIRSEYGGSCVNNPIRIGEECANSRQCAKLEAKCRRAPGAAGGGKKTCQCFNTYFVDAEGVCVEGKDRGQLEFHRLNRAPTYEEANPGRRPPPPPPRRHAVSSSLVVLPAAPLSRNDGSVLVRGHCAARADVLGEADFPTPLLPRRYFPLPLHGRGFDLGFFARGRGRGKLLLEFVHDAEPDSDARTAFRVEVGPGARLAVAADGNSRTAKVADLQAEGTAANTVALWVSMDCPPPPPEPSSSSSSSSPSASSCSLTLGVPGRKEPALALEGLPNPWTSSSSSSPRTTPTPTHVAFLPGSSDASFSVSALCTAGHGERCSHDSDCRKAHRDLQCRRRRGDRGDGKDGGVARCACPQGAARWDEADNKCSLI